MRSPASVLDVAFRRVVKPAHLELRRRASQVIDLRLGVETIDESIAASLGIDVDEFRNTQRSLGWTGTWRVLRHLGPTPHDTFLDIGCGAGRVLCAAAQFDFRRVMGIEIDSRMFSLAERNARRLKRRRCEIDIVQEDATTFAVPEDVTMVFLYNPIRGDGLSRVMARLIESVDRSPRRMRIAYANPTEHDRLMALGRFQPTTHIRLSWRPTSNSMWTTSQTVQFYELTTTRASASV